MKTKICLYCGESFSAQDNNLNHYVERNFFCEDCRKEFDKEMERKAQEILDRHENSVYAECY